MSHSKNNTIENNIFNGCLTGFLTLTDCNGIIINNNNCSDMCSYNIKNKKSSYNLMFIENCSDINICCNEIYVNDDDEYTNSIVGNEPIENFIFSNNIVNLHKNYKTYNNKIINDNILIFDGNKGVSNNNNLESNEKIINYNYLFIEFVMKDTGRFTDILNLSDYNGTKFFSSVHISNNVEFYEISISIDITNNTFSVLSSKKATLNGSETNIVTGTNDSDSPITIARIFAIKNKNNTSFMSII